MGGLGSVIKMTLDENGGQPKTEFIGPTTDLKALNEIANDLITSIGIDWGVKLQITERRATSGYQLIVEELPGLLVREKRMAAFQGGFHKFYEITKQLFPELIDGELIVKFAEASLPIDTKSQDDLWQQMILGNRASLKDYFMEVKGLSEDEAYSKIEEVINLNKQVTAGTVVTPPLTSGEALPGSGQSGEQFSIIK